MMKIASVLPYYIAYYILYIIYYIFIFNGYILIRNDRNREGGGVALYVKSLLNILIRHDLMPAELERPPNSNAHIIEIFENFLCALDKESKASILIKL